MANIFDYIDWRGDLDLTQDPFNEVDSLILSTVSYIDFELIETDLKTEKATIREAGEQFNRLHADEKIKAGRLVPDSIFRLLDVMSRTPRFRDMILSDYVNQIDEEEEKQFSAITINLGDGSYYIAYRGTDDTIVGWKEDFNMSFKAPVPSQLQALDYLEMIAKRNVVNSELVGIPRVVMLQCMLLPLPVLRSRNGSCRCIILTVRVLQKI